MKNKNTVGTVLKSYQKYVEMEVNTVKPAHAVTCIKRSPVLVLS
jgi:hypothetical protein